MTYLPGLPDDARLLDVFRAYPATARPLLDYHEALMRGPSPLTVAERELVAAYVSALNACDYCAGIHAVTAESFGVPERTLKALVQDLDTAPVEERLRPLLRLVRTVTLTPSRATPSEVAAAIEAGWDEQAVHDAVSVCALFSFMNRFVDGLGITTTPDYAALSGSRLADGGYAALKDLL